MKYTGSKARVSKEIAPILMKSIQDNSAVNYLEPFVGGANMIDKIICENKYGLDNNRYIISLWNAFKSGYTPPKFIDRDEYRMIKENRGLYEDVIVACAGIFASYNGNWFSSYGGSSTTKTGKIRNYYDEAVRNVQKQLPSVIDVEFKCVDYAEIKIKNMNNWVVYCDPPYAKNKKVYDNRNFDHEQFWDWARVLSKNNHVFVSEYEAPDDFEAIWDKQLSKMFPRQKSDTPKEKLFILKSE